MCAAFRVAITQRVIEHDGYRERRGALAQDWATWATGYSPDSVLIPVPNVPAAAISAVERLEPDVLVLSGGNDLGTARDRWATERELLAWFRQAARPVIGVCRGLHVINQVFGGHVDEIGGNGHIATVHPVDVVDAGLGLVATPGSYEVNSFHSFGVRRSGLGEGLAAFAASADGYVEALAHRDEPILAIQWHPERPDPSPDLTSDLLRAFLARSAAAVG